MGELSDRRSHSEALLEKIRNLLGDAETLASGKACVYATGSLGRGEASPHSDLDLFIASKIGADKEESLLGGLDEICIKASLVRTTRALNLPDFSGQGRYLTHFSVRDFTETLGKPEDDVTNTFTARLLLLLESRPLVEDAVYKAVTDAVVAAYWLDYQDHSETFIPAFLANDILRLWRTFCVNYESRRETIPEEKKAKGKSQNYKLKHSRLLTCYSALLYLLAVYQRQNCVAPKDAVEMISLPPTRRLEWLINQPDLSRAHRLCEGLMEKYEEFLRGTNMPEADLIARFMNKKEASQYMQRASDFGDLMFETLMAIGDRGRFHRLLVV
jgi:hypothetical protein